MHHDNARAALPSLKLLTAVGALVVALGLPGARAATPAVPQYATLGRSAQLRVDGALSVNTLNLRIYRAADAAALTSAQLVEVSASVAGHLLPVSMQPDGSWSVALPQAGGKTPGRLDLVVGHDGIRELLTVQLTPEAARAATATGAGGLFARNKQLAWWILNILIVLIAAIAIARRTS
jgi:hypothetical protein